MTSDGAEDGPRTLKTVKTLEENGFLVKRDDSDTRAVRDDRFREQSPERISRSANTVEANIEMKAHSQRR